MDERKMMALLKKQEKRALEWLYEEYSPIVYGTVKRIGQTNDATEDLLVKTFIKAWDNAPSIDIAKDRALPWVFNVLIDTIAGYASSLDPTWKASAIKALKLELNADDNKHEQNLARLERAIAQYPMIDEVPIAGAESKDTKLQQSILALRARLKINQVLMPR
ncbi:MAG: sigma factor [Phaeodactylibacter sp.]|uniref:RNA polymerase sigma factor n=1 Tax=Phaeodactylibacter sp. TaxID=1940289 RepID=UPI0032EBDD07